MIHHIGKLYKNEGSGLAVKPIIPGSNHRGTGKMFNRIYQGDLKMAIRNQIKILLVFRWNYLGQGMFF